MPSVIQQVPGSATSVYGFGTTKISTSEGSWLAVLAGWNCLTPDPYIQVPAVSVTDSAGNLWQQAAITPAQDASVRAAVWVAPNALPVSWVSVGLTGFAASVSWEAVEIAGMPQAASLDFAVGTSGSGTAPTLTWTARETGIGFAVAAVADASETAPAPSGWTALGTATAGSGTAGTMAAGYWNTAVSAGTATTALALGTGAVYAYALCSLSATASPPPQYTQNFPLVTVEAAFGAQPGNISASADWLFSSEYTGWTDITKRAIGPAVQSRIKCSRGRQYQLQQEETGTAAIPLSNVDGAFTPTNPGSPYYSNAVNPNMSFQSGVSPWTPTGNAALASASSPAFASGLNAVSSASLQVTPDGVTAGPGAQSELAAINPNYPYTASGWVYSGTAIASTGSLTGVFLNPGAMGFTVGTAAGWQDAVSAWDGWTGTGQPSCTRYYMGGSPWSIASDMSSMITNGTKLLISLQPAYNPVSASDLDAIVTFMQALQAAGAVCDICLWHEPYYAGLTSAEYTAMIAYYGPAVRRYYPLVFVTATSSVLYHGENGYYPGDAQVDKVATDLYPVNIKTDTAAYQLGQAAAVADGASPPKPFGIWEFGTSTASTVASWQTQAYGTTFIQDTQSYMQDRLAAGQPNADICWFSGAPGESVLGCGTTQNGGFEGGTGNWVAAGNCSIAQSTAHAHSGTASLLVTATTAGTLQFASCAAGSITAQGLACSPADIVDGALWFLAAGSARTCAAQIQWYDSGGTALSVTAGTGITDGTSAWTQATVAGTAPTGAAYARLLAAVQSAALSEEHYADDAELRNVTGTNAANVTTIEFGWDYRVAAWGSVYSALNNPVAVTAQAAIAWYDSSKSLLLTTVQGYSPAVPADTWTQLILAGIVPPSGAAYAAVIVEVSGTPASSAVFWAAEAALNAGSLPVRTGLVAPLTPVRVTAWWQGRRYPVWQGYAQQWPQQWPDMPQWGFAHLKASDALAAAGAGAMYSALTGEVLIDNPYAYLPCSEMYTTLLNGATPANPFVFQGGYFAPTDANGLAAVNRASGNQITGTYLDGLTQQVSTGLLMNFLGDNGTGMGATGYPAQTSGERGPSMLYQDPGLPGFPLTIEFWFVWDGTSSEEITLLTLYSTPSAFIAANPYTNGAAGSVYIQGGYLYYYSGNGTTVIAAVTPSQSPQHFVMAADASRLAYFYVNGLFATDLGLLAMDLSAIVLGPGRYTYDCHNSATYYGYNYSAGHLAVYSYQLPAERVTAHYEAGAAGWSGAGAATRFSQIMTWAQLGLKRGGYSQASAAGNPELTRIGPAYDLSGQPANSAVYTLSQSEGGRYGTQANGSLVYLERDILYNLPVSAVLADGTAPAPAALNTDPGFAAGLGGWTASGGTVSVSADRYGSLGSLLFTPSAAGTVTSPSFTYNGGSAQAGFWVNCPSGGTVTCAAVTSAATASTAAPVPGSAWTFVSVPVPAAAGVTSATLTASAGTAPFHLAYAAMWYSSGQVRYLPKSSYGFDMTYIYNEVTATQQDGPNQLVLYDARGTASMAQYFRRSALAFQTEVVSPYDVSDLTTWSLGEYQQPYLHVLPVTVDAASNPLEAFPVVLSLDQGQVAQVNRAPVGGAPITETGTVERVQQEIGAGYWRASYQLSPYGPAQAVLCADTSGYDAPGAAPALTLAW